MAQSLKKMTTKMMMTSMATIIQGTKTVAYLLAYCTRLLSVYKKVFTEVQKHYYFWLLTKRPEISRNNEFYYRISKLKSQGTNSLGANHYTL